MYQIIPRKYRPQNFKNVVGQDAIVSTLKNALQHQRLAQAYLFCGSKGTGKTSLARLFAKALNCAHLTADQEPCNACPSCKEITSGHSLDVLEIDGASNRGIDDIRQINETVSYAPSSGNYKIYIVDEVHMLTKEAFNALLKTLEEPPSHVKFFFATTEPHKVLPTIISRCQRFDLNRIAPVAMREKLQWIANDLKKEIAPEAVELLVKMSEGSLRDAESLLDQILCSSDGTVTAETITTTFGITSKAAYVDLDKAIALGDLPFAFDFAHQIFSSGKDLTAFMDGLIDHFRTHLKRLIQDPTASPPYTAEQCLYIIEFLIDWSPKLAKTPFKQVGLETILLHLIRSSKRVSLDTLVHRLLQLEKSAGNPVKASLPQQALEPQPKQPQAAAPEKVVAHAPLPEPQPKPQAVANEKKVESAPPPATKAAAPEKVPSSPPPQMAPTGSRSRYETLIRFAAVELEGSTER